MCNSCNCDNYMKCSIVGYFPIGFCCSYCNLYDEHHTCLTNETKREESEASSISKKEIKLKSASIEGELLKVTIEQDGKELPLLIDLKKYLESS